MFPNCILLELPYSCLNAASSAAMHAPEENQWLNSGDSKYQTSNAQTTFQRLNFVFLQFITWIFSESEALVWSGLSVCLSVCLSIPVYYQRYWWDWKIMDKCKSLLVNINNYITIKQTKWKSHYYFFYLYIRSICQSKFVSILDCPRSSKSGWFYL